MMLRLEHLTHNYEHTHFHYHGDISDSITALFGFSGSGKTTLMNIICGIITPSSGRLTCNGRIFFDKEKNINVPVHKRNIGTVFQEHYLFPHLTVKQNLLYSKPYIKNKNHCISFDSAVELLHLEHVLDKKPAQLSGGERQRTAIGRALLSQPELLLMDEPFSNLDRSRRKKVISQLLNINEELGIPLLIISHDLEDILKLTRSLLVIDNGEVQASGGYLELADSGRAPDIISPREYLNMFDLYTTGYEKEEDLYLFGTGPAGRGPRLKTTFPGFEKPELHSMVRLCILPDEIALCTHPVKSTSIQNQIKGTIISIIHRNTSCFVTIDCGGGLTMVAEVTRAGAQSMKISTGLAVYCLIKAKAIDYIHIYQKKRTIQTIKKVSTRGKVTV